jgi:hypothetical protein
LIKLESDQTPEARALRVGAERDIGTSAMASGRRGHTDVRCGKCRVYSSVSYDLAQQMEGRTSQLQPSCLNY